MASSVKTEGWCVSNQAFLGSFASGGHKQLWVASLHPNPTEEMGMLRESHIIILLPVLDEPVAVRAERWPEKVCGSNTVEDAQAAKQSSSLASHGDSSLSHRLSGSLLN